MKKIVALILALSMVFTLCACGGGKNNDETSLDDQQKVETATETLNGTVSVDPADYPLLINGVLEYGYNDYTGFSNYLTNGTFRAGSDFDAGDYYFIGIVQAMPKYIPATSPDELKFTDKRTFCRISISDKQFIKVSHDGILVPASEVDTYDLKQYGIFLVGKDIPAGLYKVETISKEYHTDFYFVQGGWGSYQISTDNPCEIGASFSKAEYLFDDQVYLTLENGQYVGIINLRMTYEG